MGRMCSISLFHRAVYSYAKLLTDVYPCVCLGGYVHLHAGVCQGHKRVSGAKGVGAGNQTHILWERCRHTCALGISLAWDLGSFGESWTLCAFFSADINSAFSTLIVMCYLLHAYYLWGCTILIGCLKSILSSEGTGYVMEYWLWNSVVK